MLLNTISFILIKRYDKREIGAKLKYNNEENDHSNTDYQHTSKFRRSAHRSRCIYV